jgi:diaminopimelate decarboxylase
MRRAKIFNSLERLISKDARLNSNGDLMHQVEYVFANKEKFIEKIQRVKTPCILLDSNALKNSIKEFDENFTKYFQSYTPYYAVKSNDHPYILKTVVRSGFGLDTSSGKELKLAVKVGAKKILLTGPAKSDEELELALDNADRVIINIDSFRELERLGEITNRRKCYIKAGVRVFTKYHGKWNKFGINIDEVSNFWSRAKKYPFVDLVGIQCHMSWNENVMPYSNIIRKISDQLNGTFSEDDLQKIEFIDLGGGFYPYRTEGCYAWSTEAGEIIQLMNKNSSSEFPYKYKYRITESIPIKDFSKGIANCVKKYLSTLLNNKQFSVFFEPGRIISNNSMHFALSVRDVKDKHFGIADGGTNMIGYNKFSYTYCPIVNLTHPSTEEIEFTLYGSLCTPHDIWGYYCFAEKIEEGDVLIIPFQGAYTYSLSNDFIKEIPPVYIM